MSPKTISNDELPSQQEVDWLSRMETAAHELTNVLQIIRGYVSYASKNLPDSNDSQSDLKQALIATDRAALVAHQLLDAARVENR